MKVSEALKSRRAVKRFDPEFVIPEEDFTSIMNLSFRAPSAFNLQHWRIIRVKDNDQRLKVSEAAYKQPQTTEASELLIICFDQEAWKREPFNGWNNISDEARDKLKKVVYNYFNGRDQFQRDEGMRSAGLVAQSIMLTAQEFGYDSCPMDGFNYEKMADIINLPEGIEIAMMVALGKKAEDPRPRTGLYTVDNVVFEDKFAE